MQIVLVLIVKLNGETRQWIVSMNKLCYIQIISIFILLIFIHFANQTTLKPSLAQKLKLIFKCSTIKGQINAPLWTHMEHKE